MTKLSVRDTFALGFMAFALFLGAGNIIFPPFIGLQAGSHVWTAAAGFLVTAVGLPVLSVVALAKAGGEMGNIIRPVGKIAGNALIAACYLFIGPLFASPRTATVSYELGLADYAGHSGNALY
ncbi:branched-chain amino acid transport system II carrier protein (plasmid) [Rouxiella badensis subsp. acadiensis]|nr:branched-chain amino acid transport system II carrier protein [Rouxiella badensis]QOI57954.1 branched-chain amino acid transport system II carrier protein [Rouxiella badensis subsp. acadiensis]